MRDADEEQRTSIDVDLRDYKPNLKQDEAHRSKAPVLLYGGATGGGKALALGTPILTPAGFVTMGQLSVGDFVIGLDGRPVRVLGTVEMPAGRPCYEVGFDDGEAIVADSGHLWYTRTAAERQGNARRTPESRARRRASRWPRGIGKRPDLARMNAERAWPLMPPDCGGLRTTEEIASSLEAGGRVNHSVPLASPVRLPLADLPVPPYTLGAWLGDGTRGCGGFTSADGGVLDAIRKDGFCVTKHPSSRYGYTIRGLKPLLRGLGVLDRKTVPRAYLLASLEQRLALFQGLMDTDGWADKDGGVSFSNTNPDLADAVLFLALSLGIKAHIQEGRAMLRGKDCGPSWTVGMRTGLPVFWLPRKAARLRPLNLNSCCVRRYIKTVKPVPSVPVRCIQVDAPDGMYLAGRHLVPTHNSYFLCMDALIRCLLWSGNDVGIYRWELSTFKDTTFKTLEETVLKREGLVASHNLNDHEIRLVNGSVIRYGGLKPSESASRDILKIAKSLEHNAIYVDEATDLPRAVFDFLPTRLPRRKATNVLTGALEYPPGVIRVTCNPEISYLKTVFIDRPRPGYEFVRALWSDNRANLPAGYDRTAFGHMSAEWRARYRDGDWRAAVDAEAIFPGELLLRAVDMGRRCSGWGDVEMGVDVASAGDDLSVVVLRRGAGCEVIYERNEPNILTFAGAVAGYSAVHRPRLIKVDAIGLGEGVWRDLERRGLPVRPIVGGASAEDETGNYLNQRAEIYWHLRKLLQEGRVALPDHPEMINELGTIKYSATPSGRTIQVESKKTIRKRLGHSPDLADAVVYAYAYSSPAFVSVLL